MTAGGGRDQARQKKIVIAGAILLVPLLAFQVPRTLKMLRGGETAAAEAVSPSTPGPATATSGGTASLVAATGAPPRQLAARVAKYPLKDPFVPIVATASSRQSSPASVPAGVPPQPSALSLKVAPAPRPSIRPNPEPVVAGTVPRGAYIVVLRSIPVAVGRAVATGEARRFRRAGLTGVGVLLSSGYSSLHGGYYVVHSGSYKTVAAARRAARLARSHSPGAYQRKLRR